jgi:hypothetical protein
MGNDMMKLAVVPVFAATLLLAQSGAHAFTFENNGTPNGGGSSIVDPDAQVKGPGTASTTSREGFHFSAGPSSGSGLRNQSDPPPAWVGNPLFLDKGPSQRDQ